MPKISGTSIKIAIYVSLKILGSSICPSQPNENINTFMHYAREERRILQFQQIIMKTYWLKMSLQSKVLYNVNVSFDFNV